MAIYSNLSKLARVKLPGGGTYALVDKDGRLMIAPDFSVEASYNEGDHVVYGDNLYRFKTQHAAGEWNSAHVDGVTVDTEIKRLEGLISGGVHYRGQTTTALFDGSTTNPISIGGQSYTAEHGDLVMVDRTIALTYAVNTAYNAHTYLVNDGVYYITTEAITAEENTSIIAIEEKLDALRSNPMFLFDGTTWNGVGSLSEGLGDLAFKDSASGTYVKPSGSGSVTIHTTSSSNAKLDTVSYSVVKDTDVDVSKIVAKNDGSALGDTTLSVGDAKVKAEKVALGTSLTGVTTFNTDAIKAASLTGETTFNTDAIKAAELTGTTTFKTEGIVASVDGDCLEFTQGATSSVGISTTAASTGTVGISTTAASTGSVSLGTTQFYEVEPTKVTIEIAAKNVADRDTTKRTFAAGTVSANGSGDTVITSVSESDVSATVTVGTTTDTVTVR